MKSNICFTKSTLCIYSSNIANFWRLGIFEETDKMYLLSCLSDIKSYLKVTTRKVRKLHKAE